MRSVVKILILDNILLDVDKIIKCLKENGYDIPPTVAHDEKTFIEQLNIDRPDVILSEHILPGFNSFRALDIARQKYPGIVFILVSGDACEEFAIELLKEGIDDYVLKNHLLRLPHVIETSYIMNRYQNESQKLALTNEELIKANEIIEQRNKSMIQSIIFAERIQGLTLPKIDIVLKSFPEAFILYRPKDIVSGDFYWFNNINDRFIAVVADCTGHGVSGALLSMIGSGFLNEIVENEENIQHPKDILSLLDTNMCKLLHQDTSTGYQDGIDIALCSIDQSNKMIYFSGCKRPLLHYKRKEKQIVEYKGEPYLIGGVDSRVVKTFKTQEIPYKTGDYIYMFTDGYVDQFGGTDDKKLMKDRFIEWLESFKHLNLNYQGQLLEQKLIRWRGNYEQTDDILVVGIKL